MTVPSNTKMSSGRLPSAQSANTFCALAPSSSPSDGCQSRSSPKSTIRSTTLGSSALRNDIVLPEHAPPWNHSTDAMGTPFTQCGGGSALVEAAAEGLGDLQEEPDPAGHVRVAHRPQQGQRPARCRGAGLDRLLAL